MRGDEIEREGEKRGMLQSSNELGELLHWPCHHDSVIKYCYSYCYYYGGYRLCKVCGANAGGQVKAHGENVKSSLALIERTASERGLSSDDITSLVIAATSSKLRQSFHISSYRTGSTGTGW